MTVPTVDEVYKYASNIIAVCSILHLSMPPVSAFDGYPKTQSAYNLIVRLIGWFALNNRSRVEDKPGASDKIQGA
jgi:hypothetical protein